MASEKSGMWFLELILNILLLGGVAFVTFAARGEQERGLAVPLFAAVSPATTRTAVEGTGPTSNSSPAMNPLPAANLPTVDPNAVTQAVNQAVDGTSKGVGALKTQGTQTFEQAWGTLQIWAAGLDGKITGEELKKIQDTVGKTWSGSQGVRDYLKQVNDKINAGQADQVVQEALKTLGQQANEKKMQAINSVVGFMNSNGVSKDQIVQVLGQWINQALKMSPMDVWNSIKF